MLTPTTSICHITSLSGQRTRRPKRVVRNSSSGGELLELSDGEGEAGYEDTAMDELGLSR